MAAPTRSCLGSPFVLKWPTLDKEENKNILAEIRRIFPPQGVQRKKKEQQVDCVSGEPMFVTWEKVKTSLVVGVNEVTKALETDKLSLVLVCRSVKSHVLTDHIRFLSITRSTPACALYGLSEVLAPLLGIKFVAACGFRKDITVQTMKDVVEYILCKVPPLSLSWTRMWQSTSRKMLDTKPDLSCHVTGDSEYLVQNPCNRNIHCSRKTLQGDKVHERKEDDFKCQPEQEFFHPTYVGCHVKALRPSGKTKAKVKKVKPKRVKR